MKTLILFLFIWALFSLNAPSPDPSAAIFDDSEMVSAVLEELGDVPLPHQPDRSLEGVSAERGRKLVLSPDPAGRGGLVSKHFTCTACHNVERDEPDLKFDDPQARLDYVAEKGLPFLPGSALYGIVNRTSFYNGDYEKKYGDLVRPARNDLREAIQLCAIECSQGRPLDTLEMESVLAYLWTIGLKMADLDLDEGERKQIRDALEGKAQKEPAIRLIKSKYAQGAPASFVVPPDNRAEGYPVAKKDPANGKLIYDLSCMHCHGNQRFALFRLDDTKFTHKYLQKHIPRYTRYSMYQVVRWGTSPIPGKRSYMPNYTKEKLSDQMVEDLRAYIAFRARTEKVEEEPLNGE